LHTGSYSEQFAPLQELKYNTIQNIFDALDITDSKGSVGHFGR